MFAAVSPDLDLPKVEREVLKLWGNLDLTNQLLAKNATRGPWTLLDGPITANRPMGIHHAWGRTYKDCYQRFFSMAGFRPSYRAGFDCQGLCVELEVEAKLGLGSKRDIVALGIAKFCEMCEEHVEQCSRVQTEQSIRMGYQMDWRQSRYTCSAENNYAAWGLLAALHGDSLIEKRRETLPWCPRCGIGFSVNDLVLTRPAENWCILLRLPVVDRPGDYLLVYTDDPWTLPANIACFVNPDATYVRLRRGDAAYYLLEERTSAFQLATAPIEARMPGRELEGWRYRLPFESEDVARAAGRRIRCSAEVPPGLNTGIVHLAPASLPGQGRIAERLGLPTVNPVDDCGDYLPMHGELAGVNALNSRRAIEGMLRTGGCHLDDWTESREVPVCPRCESRLIHRDTSQWYLRMSCRDRLQQTARQIRWIPESGLDSMIARLERMDDWLLTMDRFWGVAVPIFECSCGWFDVVGSEAELKRRTVSGWDDFAGHVPHRPWIDGLRVKCGACGSPVPRIPQVGNPLLDSAVLPFSTPGYFTDHADWKRRYPADLVAECLPGQVRDWFFALLLAGATLSRRAPVKVILGHGLVRDAAGQEMHKTAGNALRYECVADVLGADAIRWSFCRHSPAEEYIFSETKIAEETEKGILELWRTFVFFNDAARASGVEPERLLDAPGERAQDDQLVIHRLNRIVESGYRSMSDYKVEEFVIEAEKFLEFLHGEYLAHNRSRFLDGPACGKADLAAFAALYEVLVTLAVALAPITPFLSELIYGHLVADQFSRAARSVHLLDHPCRIDMRSMIRGNGNEHRMTEVAGATGHGGP